MYLRWEQAEDYLREQARKGCAPETLRSYRWNLQYFFSALEEGLLTKNTAAQWRDNMLAQGYQPSTVKHRLSTVNRLLAFLGLWEFQGEYPQVPEGEQQQPELSRGEYLRLLSAARSQKKRRVYLLCKVFASTGVPLHDLEQLTVEALAQGEIPPGRPLPPTLRQELSAYAAERGLQSGPLFVTRSGRPLSRANITSAIQQLAAPAKLPPEKCNPRCLQRLYHATLQGIRQQVALLVTQAHDHLLEQEQLAIGWN